LADYYPKFHVTCITHKKNAIYPTTIVGIPPQEDAWLGKATERIFLAPIRLSMLPELTDMDLPVYGVAHNLTLVSIKKDFAGHALKVMSALWGAGQMMFNKALVVVDNEIDVHDYKQVALAFLEHLNPSSDIHFSMGPLDILDHSSSKYAFGSKLCVDATPKFVEELTPNHLYKHVPIVLDLKEIKQEFKFIENVSIAFSNDQYYILFISIKKEGKISVKEMAEVLYESKLIENVKLLVCFDSEVIINDIPSSVWILTNNIDPKRDCSFFEGDGRSSCMVVDATRKTSDGDRFERDWPNIIISDEDTIKKIDLLWGKLNIGPLIESPSTYYKPLVPVNGSVLKLKKQED